MAANQSQNSTGWQINDLNRLRRFLCYGTEGNVYHSVDKEYNIEQTQSLCRLVESGHGTDVVSEISSFSAQRKAAKIESVIFALAVCARSTTDLKTKQAAYKALGKVCQSPVHLFHFVNFAEKLSGDHTGWGRAQRKAIKEWYNNKDVVELAQGVTKYKQRNGWSHVDLLRLAHVKPTKDSTALVLKYVIKGLEESKKQFGGDGATAEMQELLRYLEAVDVVKHTKDEQQAARLIEEFHLCKEHVPTGLLNSKEVWRALLQQMSLPELLHHLGKLTALGLLDPLSNNNHAQVAIDRLMNESCIVDSRVHPFAVLSALRTYETGKAEKGRLKWMPNGAIIDALNQAYYTAFKNVTPTERRYMVAIDVSSTLTFGGVNGSPLVRPLLVAAAISQLIAKTEPHYQIVSYSQSVTPMCLTPQMSIQEVVKSLAELTRQMPTTGSDCAMPITWATENKKEVDVFVVVTDCDAFAGQTQPAQALRKYRQDMNINDARMVLCSLTSSGLSVADPDDAGMLDILGYDVNTPNVIHNFASGAL